MIRCKDLGRCTSGIIRHIRMVQMHQGDASDETSRLLGIKAEVEVEVEVDVRG